MISIRHFLEPVEHDEGQRLWVEPIGLTKDLVQMCSIHHVLPHLGPPMELWNWFQEHPDGYEYFRGRYHEYLSRGPYRAALMALAHAALNENFTLVHQSDDAEKNPASALYEYLIELQAYKSPEA